MNSPADDPKGSGFPIRKSTDQRVLAPPRGLSQRATSFIASVRQGIHQMPLKRLIQRNPVTSRNKPGDPFGSPIFSRRSARSPIKDPWPQRLTQTSCLTIAVRQWSDKTRQETFTAPSPAQAPDQTTGPGRLRAIKAPHLTKIRSTISNNKGALQSRRPNSSLHR